MRRPAALLLALSMISEPRRAAVPLACVSMPAIASPCRFSMVTWPRVAKKLKLQERRAVIPSRRSLAACRPLGFLGRSRAPSRIGGHTRGTYGVGTYPGLHHRDGGP